MKKIASCLLAVTMMAPLNSLSIADEPKHDTDSEIITLNVALFVDPRLNNRSGKFGRLVEEVSAELEKEVGLKLCITSTHLFRTEINQSKEKINLYLDGFAPDEPYRVIFSQTNPRCDQVKYLLPKDTCGNAQDRLLGAADRMFCRFIFIFNPTDQFFRKSDGGQCLASVVMKHEIGHLLGLSHNDDKNSIMYYCPVDSKGQWSPDEIKEMRCSLESR